MYIMTLTRPVASASTGVPSSDCQPRAPGGSSATSGHTADAVAIPRAWSSATADASAARRRVHRRGDAECEARRAEPEQAPRSDRLRRRERARMRERRLEIEQHLARRDARRGERVDGGA